MKLEAVARVGGIRRDNKCPSFQVTIMERLVVPQANFPDRLELVNRLALFAIVLVDSQVAGSANFVQQLADLRRYQPRSP